MGRSYIRTTLIAAIVLVQMTAYAQTAAEAAKNNDSASVSNASAQAPASVKNEVVVVTTAPQAIEQPTTIVTAAPLAPSRAEDIRKARERAEVETEQGIVEKLEKDRLEDETKRREELFQARKKKQQPVAVEEVAPVIVVAPVVAAPAPAAPAVVSAPTATVVSTPAADAVGKATVTATTEGNGSPATATATITSAAAAPSEPTVVIQAPQKTEAELRQEIESDVRAEQNAQAQSKANLKAISKEEKPGKSRIAVGGVLSTMSYPDAYNTNSDFGAGVSFGWTMPNRIGVEGTFLYSQHTIDDSYAMYKQVDQQNWMVAARYNILATSVTPVVGALMSYTHREYTDMYDWGYGVSKAPGSTSTDALDVGFILGVEFNASKNIVLGVDYRYVTNLTSRYSDPEAFNRSIYDSNDRDYRPLEEIDYDMIAFSLKFLF